MALKKSQLYSSLWQSCDELRGGMDASQYKDYVLTLLFMKYVSDKYAGKPGALIEVPSGGGFADMVKLKGDKEIGDKINKIIGRLAEANDLKGVIDQAAFNDEGKLGTGKEMQDRLSKLVAIFDGLDFRGEVKLATRDYIDMKMYEPAMRHLLDTYIRAEESEKLSAFDDLTLVQLIVERGEAAVDSLPKSIRENSEAVAETIENNVRRLIIDEMAVNPKYYEKMSELLDALIAQRKQEAMDYKTYLARIVALTKQVSHPETQSSH